MAFKLLDRARMSVTGAPGTGDISLGVATTGYQTFFQAGVSDGDDFPYSITDGTAWEYGIATYTFSGNKISRAVSKTSAQNATPLSLSSNAIVSACIRAEDVAGNTTLAGLSDVNITPNSGIDGQVVYWNNTDGRFETKVVSGGGGGATTLQALTDVNIIEGPAIDGWTLNWNNGAGKWHAVAPVTPGISSAAVSTLTDVTLTSLSDGQVLTWSATDGKWENKTPSGGGGGSLTVGGHTGITDIEFSGATVAASGTTATVTVSGGGGGGGGGTSSWTTLTFGSTTSAFSETVYPSTQTFTVAAGDLIEVQGYVHATGSTNGEIIIGSSTTSGYSFKAQSDGNFVLYWFQGGSTGALTAQGGNSQYAYTGVRKIDLSVVASASGDKANIIWGSIDGYYPNNATTQHDGSNNVEMVGTVTIYVTTDDITKCAVRARIVNASTLANIFN